MQIDPSQFDAETRSFFGATAIAILGGLVRALRSDKCSTRAVIVELSTSAFAGIVVWFLIAPCFDGARFAEYYRVAIVGISGHIAPKLLDTLGKKATKFLGGCVK